MVGSDNILMTQNFTFPIHRRKLNVLHSYGYGGEELESGEIYGRNNFEHEMT